MLPSISSKEFIAVFAYIEQYFISDISAKYDWKIKQNTYIMFGGRGKKTPTCALAMRPRYFNAEVKRRSCKHSPHKV